jgi:alpha-glucosidase
MWQRSGHVNLGRDGCRVPLPWSGDQPPFGFQDGESRTWLPQPPGWAGLTVEAENADPASMLSLYRHALQVRHAEPAFTTDAFTWLPAPPDVLCYRRGANVTVMINVSGQPAELPPYEAILAASHPIRGDVLPPGTGVWLRTRPPAS